MNTENIIVNGIEYAPLKQSKPRVIRVCYELTMPTAGSWNGKWSGSEHKHYLVKDFSPKYFENHKDKILGTWYYSWNDGWSACISTEVVDGRESARRKKISRGFCGYEWMIDSILKIGKILTSDDLRKYLEEQGENQ